MLPMQTVQDELLAALPHRPPFRFITRLTRHEPGASAEAVWAVGESELFLKGHFPGNPIVPGVLLVEALAQVSGVAAAHQGAQHASGRLAHCDVRFHREVRPPASVILRSILSRTLGKLHQFEVEAVVGGHIVARGTVALALEDGEAAPRDES